MVDTSSQFDVQWDCISSMEGGKMEKIELRDLNEGHKRRVNSVTLWTIIGVVATVVICSLIIIPLSNTSKDNIIPESYLSYSNYVKIENGMTYREVVNILNGNEGVLDSSSGFGDYTLSYYTWSNTLSTRIIVVGFQNGLVCTKSQVGLK